MTRPSDQRANYPRPRQRRSRDRELTSARGPHLAESARSHSVPAGCARLPPRRKDRQLRLRGRRREGPVHTLRADHHAPYLRRRPFCPRNTKSAGPPKEPGADRMEVQSRSLRRSDQPPGAQPRDIALSSSARGPSPAFAGLGYDGPMPDTNQLRDLKESAELLGELLEAVGERRGQVPPRNSGVSLLKRPCAWRRRRRCWRGTWTRADAC